MFPQSRKKHHMEKRDNEKYFVTLPYMKRMLNDKEKQRQKIMKWNYFGSSKTHMKIL